MAKVMSKTMDVLKNFMEVRRVDFFNKSQRLEELCCSRKG